MNAVKSTPCAATRRRPAWLALATLVMLALPLQQARSDDFDVRTANMRLADGYWRLTARIDYHLTDKALAALDNGVALTFRVEVSASRVRRWWTNKEIIDVERDWQLSYEPLTKRYLVKYPDDREETSHATLFGALNAMGRVQGLPIVEASRMNANETYEVAIRAVLDQRTLPGPLQMLAFWGGGFSLESDWYEWTMAP
jgi:hypothetical protein